MIATATLKYLGVSAQKTRLVIDQVRGRTVGDARSILQYSAKRVAFDLKKLLDSAVANAQQKEPGVDVDALVVSRAVVNEAPPLKRSRNQSMGRVFPVLKRTCHVTLAVESREAGGAAAAAGAPGGG